MSIPLYYFLFAYFIFLAAFVVFSIVHIYHIVATASLTLPSFIVAFLVIVLTVVTLFWTVSALAGTDFTADVRLFDGMWLDSGSSNFSPSIDF